MHPQQWCRQSSHSGISVAGGMGKEGILLSYDPVTESWLAARGSPPCLQIRRRENRVAAAVSQVCCGRGRGHVNFCTLKHCTLLDPAQQPTNEGYLGVRRHANVVGGVSGGAGTVGPASQCASDVCAMPISIYEVRKW